MRINRRLLLKLCGLAAARAQLRAGVINPVFLSLCGSASGPVTPTKYSGLTFWTKSDDLVLSDGDPVSTWSDQSGNANDATNTLTLRPTYKTAIFGSSPVVRFNGSTQYLNLTSNVTLSGSYTIMAVCAVSGDSQLFGNLGTNYQIRIKRSGSNILSAYDNSTEALSGTMTAAASAVRLVSWVRSGGFTSFYEGSTSLGSSSSSNAGGSIVLSAMGDTSFGGFFNGDIAEVLIYTTARSAGEVKALYDSYFKTRYSTLT